MIIGLGHKKQVGKNTVADIICNLDDVSYNINIAFEIHSFANKLKQVASIIYNIPIEKWEDPIFKEQIIGYGKEIVVNGVHTPELITPRVILQKIGESLRNGVDENIWVDALLNTSMLEVKEARSNKGIEGDAFPKESINRIITVKKELPNWIITDVRYKNEADAIKSLGGILIRVDRNTELNDDHISETALDDYDGWDYVIDNNGTLGDLRNKVRELYDRTGGFKVLK